MAPTKLQMIHPSAQEQRENSGGGSQWPSSWRTGTWPPHWRGQCAPCNANVLVRQRLDSSTWLYARHAATVFGIAMISNIVKDMRQGALWHMWQNRKCPPMETLSWKILHVSLYHSCTYPFPVLYALVRTGVLSIALLTLTNPKNIGNSQKTKKQPPSC